MARESLEAPSQEDDRQRRWQKAAEFNDRPVLTLLCGGAMLLFGLVPIGSAVDMAWSARHWIETPIEVIGAGLRQSETNSDLGTVVSEARATYRYRRRQVHLLSLDIGDALDGRAGPQPFTLVPAYSGGAKGVLVCTTPAILGC